MGTSWDQNSDDEVGGFGGGRGPGNLDESGGPRRKEVSKRVTRRRIGVQCGVHSGGVCRRGLVEKVTLMGMRQW